MCWLWTRWNFDNEDTLLDWGRLVRGVVVDKSALFPSEFRSIFILLLVYAVKQSGRILYLPFALTAF